MATDGVDLAWVEVSAEPGSMAVLRAAPFTADPTTLAPRDVAALPELAGTASLHRRVLVGGGWAMVDLGGRFALVHLADGARRTFVPPAGPVEVAAEWLSAEELAVATKSADNRLGLVRFPVASIAGP